jgi:hypothetical protein
MRGGVIDVARAAVDPDEAIRGDDRDDRQETEGAADVGADQTHDAARQVPALRPNALDAPYGNPSTTGRRGGPSAASEAAHQGPDQH